MVLVVTKWKVAGDGGVGIPGVREEQQYQVRDSNRIRDETYRPLS